MADPRMMSIMFGGGIASNRHENSASALPLPLNLIALIISYVCGPKLERTNALPNHRRSSTAHQTLVVCVGLAGYSIT